MPVKWTNALKRAARELQDSRSYQRADGDGKRQMLLRSARKIAGIPAGGRKRPPANPCRSAACKITIPTGLKKGDKFRRGGVTYKVVAITRKDGSRSRFARRVR